MPFLIVWLWRKWKGKLACRYIYYNTSYCQVWNLKCLCQHYCSWHFRLWRPLTYDHVVSEWSPTWTNRALKWASRRVCQTSYQGACPSSAAATSCPSCRVDTLQFTKKVKLKVFTLSRIVILSGVIVCTALFSVSSVIEQVCRDGTEVDTASSKRCSF